MAKGREQKGTVVIVQEVPFFANTPDGTHCYQAVLRSILKYFESEKEFSWPELERITAKVEGLWTWPMAGELWLQNHGYTVQVATLFDYRAFIARGGEYMIEKNGRVVAEKQIANSNIPQEQRIAKEFIAKVKVERHIPTYEELLALIDEGNLVVVNINSRVLAGMAGFVGHFLLVVGYDQGEIVVHDPGGRAFAGQAYRHIPRGVFEAAWAYPDQTEKEFIAVRKK